MTKENLFKLMKTAENNGFIQLEDGFKLVSKDWMIKNIRYRNFDKLKSPEELENTRCGSCHDQSFYIANALKDIPGISKIKIYFVLEYDDSGNGGETHSFVTYEKNNKKYYMETAWEDNRGIHELSESVEKMFENYHKKGKFGNIGKYENIDVSGIVSIFKKK